jgi:hypothetical protein
MIQHLVNSGHEARPGEFLEFSYCTPGELRVRLQAATRKVAAPEPMGLKDFIPERGLEKVLSSEQLLNQLAAFALVMNIFLLHFSYIASSTTPMT